MKSYNPTFQEAVSDLQKKGYREDFVLFGNDLLWIQQKLFLDSSEFSISDCLSLAYPQGKDGDLVLYCVEILKSGIKGILMNNYYFTSENPPVILQKLHSMRFYSLQTQRSFE